jgi:hypothetical protein
MRVLLKLMVGGLVLPLAACSLLPPTEQRAGGGTHAPTPAQPGVAASSFSGWQHWLLPGKQATDYAYARLDGRDTMAAKAESSASMLRQVLRIEPQALGHVKFSWKVPELIAQADLGQREVADAPVRVVLAFEGDRSKFSLKNAMLSELSHAITGEPLPYATLMYVWCNTRAADSVIINPRTDRIRKLVVESGARHLNQWLDYERDVRADFEKVFGEPPGALVGIGIMTDTDNTRSSSVAWYGPLSLSPMTPSKNQRSIVLAWVHGKNPVQE